MKNFQKIKFTIVGVVALITTVALNVRHALNEYGVMDNKLHLSVLAQSNNNAGGTTNSGTGNTTGAVATGDCTDTVTRSGGLIFVEVCNRKTSKVGSAVSMSCDTTHDKTCSFSNSCP
jgi:hypothetical protein